jgi:hypothetical protein
MKTDSKSRHTGGNAGGHTRENLISQAGSRRSAPIFARPVNRIEWDLIKKQGVFRVG